MGIMDSLSQRWYAHPDDFIGGWCAMNVDKPPSQAQLVRDEFAVCSFTREEVARHIVELHNRWLDERAG